jgi:uncharacterized protein YlxW (UPF0749 family)
MDPAADATGPHRPEHSRSSTPRPAPGSTGDVGLLEYVVAHAVDDDYARAHDQQGGGNARIGTLLVVAAFVILLITAATQTSRNSVSDAAERADLAKQVTARRNELARRQHTVDKLTKQTRELNAALSGNVQLSNGTRSRLSALGAAAGTTAVSGPGVIVTVDDAPKAHTSRETVLDTDLQQLVNGLWKAGAEAIAINGERITSLTAIRQAGQAITVNYNDLSRPYVVSAIGDAATLGSRFEATPNGQTWLDLHQQIGLRFDLIVDSHIELPGAQVDLRAASVPKGGEGP